MDSPSSKGSSISSVGYVFSSQISYAYAAEDPLPGEGEVRISLLGKYDSADTAAIKQINTISKTIQLRNLDTGKNYTLKYDNTSQITDIHGTMIMTGKIRPVITEAHAPHSSTRSFFQTALRRRNFMVMIPLLEGQFISTNKVRLMRTLMN